MSIELKQSYVCNVCKETRTFEYGAIKFERAGDGLTIQKHEPLGGYVSGSVAALACSQTCAIKFVDRFLGGIDPCSS